MNGRARALIRAAAASLVLHGAAAAAVLLWERSRGAEASAPAALNVAVDVVWVAAPSARAAPPDAARTVKASTATQATPVATQARASAAPLTALTGAADSLSSVISEVSLLAASPASAALVSTEIRPVAVVAIDPGAATDALAVSGAARGAVLTPASGAATRVVASAPGPMWAPAGRRNVRPTYPPLARRRGLEGRTILKVEILSSGRSGSVALISSSGHALLDDAALAAVRQWTFVAAGDVAHDTTTFIEIPVSFRLVD